MRRLVNAATILASIQSYGRTADPPDDLGTEARERERRPAGFLAGPQWHLAHLSSGARLSLRRTLLEAAAAALRTSYRAPAPGPEVRHDRAWRRIRVW